MEAEIGQGERMMRAESTLISPVISHHRQGWVH